MNKNFANELMLEMHQELVKITKPSPNLSKAVECLHAALDIFEEQDFNKQAKQILNLLNKVGQNKKQKPLQEIPSMKVLMEKGITQQDLMEFTKGNPVAKAKLNLVLRELGISEHQIGKLIGPGNVMSEKDARSLMDPNRSFGKIFDWMNDPAIPVDINNPQPGEALEFKSLAKKKKDLVTKGLTEKKQVKNLEEYGTPLNVPKRKDKLSAEDFEEDFADLLSAFDLNSSDEELMNMEVKEDSFEVFDADDNIEDFEDERN